MPDIPANTDFIRNISKKILSESLSSYFFNKAEPDTVHFPLDMLFPFERRISSIMGGLQTSLGITLWERLAKKIAGRNGFTVRHKTDIKMPKPMPERLSNVIDKWRPQREDEGANIGLANYIDELREVIPSISREGVNFIKLTKGEGIDLLFEKEIDGIRCEYAFDIKTVQINAGSGIKLNHTLMKWYAFRLFQDVDIDFRARMVFPYNPYPGSDLWEKDEGKLYPLDKENDIFIGAEFWNFLGGNGSWTAICEGFQELDGAEINEAYKAMFRSSLGFGKAKILALKNNCILITEETNFSEGSELEWKCNGCSNRFEKSFTQFQKMLNCPCCERNLNELVPIT